MRPIGALDDVVYDPGIVAKDHGQYVFRQSFEQFAGCMVNSYRLHKGQALTKQYGAAYVRPDRAGLRRTRRCRRDLGARDRFRRGSRHYADIARAGDACQ
jgi:hypothetical protein